ncbi:YTH domain protein [Niveomyces insectorum RCEF 264]|uniref:YTH domain protein n=1 Tax=Niveomyces insectorum RCEF 264 TaxID=1081102 RepID=A0A167N7V6_9HYPO|nr:YTH domain protein [Niveomyces insectorum RCEF 264]
MGEKPAKSWYRDADNTNNGNDNGGSSSGNHSSVNMGVVIDVDGVSNGTNPDVGVNSTTTTIHHNGSNNENGSGIAAGIDISRNSGDQAEHNNNETNNGSGSANVAVDDVSNTDSSNDLKASRPSMTGTVSNGGTNIEGKAVQSVAHDPPLKLGEYRATNGFISEHERSRPQRAWYTGMDSPRPQHLGQHAVVTPLKFVRGDGEQRELMLAPRFGDRNDGDGSDNGDGNHAEHSHSKNNDDGAQGVEVEEEEGSGEDGHDNSNDHTILTGRHGRSSTRQQYSDAVHSSDHDEDDYEDVLPPKHTLRKLILGSRGDCHFFLIRSSTLRPVLLAMRAKTWYATARQAIPLAEAFHAYRTVVVVFAVNREMVYRGYGRVVAVPTAAAQRKLAAKSMSDKAPSSVAPTAPFHIAFHSRERLPFALVNSLRNDCHGGRPVNQIPDGQEIDEACARALLATIDPGQLQNV